MQDYVLNGSKMRDRESMHDELTACFSLPDYYGRNLDALWDVLSENSAARRIVFKNPEEMPQALFSTLAALLLDLGRALPQTHIVWESDRIRPGLYRHFKGREYRVLHLALHSETLQPMVVYQAMYGDQGIWVRPAQMWNETIEREGKTLPRFVRIGD